VIKVMPCCWACICFMVSLASITLTGLCAYLALLKWCASCYWHIQKPSTIHKQNNKNLKLKGKIELRKPHIQL
jgi:hypothetical protein